MSELLLGIDVGTSAVKAGVFDAAGRLLGLGRTRHSVRSPEPGWAECDPEDWWRGILRALSEACANAGVQPADIVSVGVGTLYPCIVPLDADARALHPAILYCDLRSLAQVQAIEHDLGRDDYERVIGNNLVPGTCAATSLMWVRDERPRAYASAHSFGFANTFVTARLTGQFGTDPSHVAVSGLVDIRNPWEWSGSLCDRLRLDAGRLPAIVGSGDAVGQVTSEAARKTGLAPGTPVACGGGDVLTSTVGAGGRSAETLVYIAGSTDCTALPLPRPAPGLRWANSAYVQRGTWLSIGTTSASGAAVDWCARELLGSDPEGMTGLAASAPAGANGLIFLPYLNGERTPIWDPRARGVFVGLTAATTRSDLARAVFEGTAFALRQLVEGADDAAGAPIRRIRAVGGATANALLNQIKADVLGIPLHVLDFQETGVLGAALLGGLAADLYASFDDALSQAASLGVSRTFAPQPAQAAVYRRMFSVYADAYPAMRAVMHRLADLAHR